MKSVEAKIFRTLWVHNMRKDDQGKKTHFRAENRIFQVDDQWWFTTREGDRGPYASRQAAADELTAYILEKRGNVELSDPGVEALEDEERDIWDGHLD